MEKRKVVFIKNDKALKECKHADAIDEKLIKLNCEFLQQKISEGYDPVCYDYFAGGFYFFVPSENPFKSFSEYIDDIDKEFDHYEHIKENA